MSQNAASDQHNLRDEYDFSGGVRGKHHEAYRSGTNVVFLDPDVAEVFKDSRPRTFGHDLDALAGSD